VVTGIGRNVHGNHHRKRGALLSLTLCS
jgi:hypothetical protein